ncbi:MAG TPA: PhzF family phenazine biosynthesis protein [Thermoanaerobaculia bacterium]|nr:PhzF family phenazine biosynthesis protein [Thermoanaerobaculia bacterium]
MSTSQSQKERPGSGCPASREAPFGRRIGPMLMYHVDAFTNLPFGGNPAAVCLLSAPGDESWMSSLARELNLPMTAFVVPDGAAESFRLRWFGVRGEAPLCGHATLAAAHVLWQSATARPGEAIRFLTASGALHARQLAAGWTELDFPAEVAVEEDRPGLAEALGVTARWIGRNRLHYLVEVESESAVRAVQPDFQRLEPLLAPARGVVVTARADAGGVPAAAGAPGAETRGGHDFVSRFFAPAMGIYEDQVTGSAHCALGPYWAAKLGRTELAAFQASPRGGTLRVRVAGDRVFLAGQAVSLLRSEMLVPAKEEHR